MPVSVVVLCVVALAGCAIVRPGSGAPDYEGNRAKVAGGASLRAAEQATVRIRNLGCGALATGSGVVISPTRLLTNAHVIAGAETLEISLWDGSTLEAEVTGSRRRTDLATVDVAIDLTGEKNAAVASFAAEDPVAGDALFAFGFPGGGGFSVLDGEAIGYAEVEGVRSLLMTNKVVPGNSGGPVFDSAGQVAGIVRAQLVESGDGVAIPVSQVQASLASLETGPSGARVACGAF